MIVTEPGAFPVTSAAQSVPDCVTLPTLATDGLEDTTVTAAPPSTFPVRIAVVPAIRVVPFGGPDMVTASPEEETV